jgi:hypothetical protein
MWGMAGSDLQGAVGQVQNVADHEEFQDMDGGQSRISEDRHFSASAMQNEGQTCAADHGTHVASLAAGFERGAAKDATIVSGSLHLDNTPIFQSLVALSRPQALA